MKSSMPQNVVRPQIHASGSPLKRRCSIFSSSDESPPAAASNSPASSRAAINPAALRHASTLIPAKNPPVRHVSRAPDWEDRDRLESSASLHANELRRRAALRRNRRTEKRQSQIHV